MFLEQVCYWGPKGDKKTKTIPRKLEKGTGQTGHHESVPMLVQGGRKGPPHSLYLGSLHCKTTEMNPRGLCGVIQPPESREHVT